MRESPSYLIYIWLVDAILVVFYLCGFYQSTQKSDLPVTYKRSQRLVVAQVDPGATQIKPGDRILALGQAEVQYPEEIEFLCLDSNLGSRRKYSCSGRTSGTSFGSACRN